MSATNVGERPRTPRNWTSWLWGVLAALLTPFVITGLFRILPTAAPTWLPLAAFALIAAAMWAIPSVARSIPMGIAAGAAAWTVFVYWLFSRWGSGSG